MSDLDESTGLWSVIREFAKKPDVQAVLGVICVLAIVINFIIDWKVNPKIDRIREKLTANIVKMEVDPLKQSLENAQSDIRELEQNSQVMGQDIKALSSEQIKCCADSRSASSTSIRLDAVNDRLTTVEGKLGISEFGDSNINNQLVELRGKLNLLSQRVDAFNPVHHMTTRAGNGDEATTRRVSILESRVDSLSSDYKELQDANAGLRDAGTMHNEGLDLRFASLDSEISRAKGERIQIESDIRLELTDIAKRLEVLEVAYQANVIFRTSASKKDCSNPKVSDPGELTPPSRIAKTVRTDQNISDRVTVLLCVYLDVDGSVERVEHLADRSQEGPPSWFVKEAKVLASKDTYQPAILRGKPVPWRHTVTVVFDPR